MILVHIGVEGQGDSGWSYLGVSCSPYPFNFFFNVLFIFERQRQSTSGGGAERERETQNPKQAPGSELSAQSPTLGSNSGTVRS